MKRTNVVVDEEIVEEARQLTGLRTLREIVDAGLRELVAREHRKRLFRLRDQLVWEGDLEDWRDR